MLYSEFLENTGENPSERTYDIFKHLEALYLEYDDISKESIYCCGRLLGLSNIRNVLQDIVRKEMFEVITSIDKAIEELDSLEDTLKNL